MKGSLRRQSPKSFSFVVDLPRGADGQRRQKAFTIKKTTKADAEVEAAQLITELERGIYVDAAEMMLGVYLERWLYGDSVAGRRRNLGALCGDRPLSSHPCSRMAAACEIAAAPDSGIL